MVPKSCQRLHLAIALAILSHKPPEQSLLSYLIDVKTRFPAIPHSQDLPVVRENNHRSRLADEDHPWRKRALDLEEENEALRLRAEKHELEYLALKSASTLPDGSTMNAELQPSQAPKKKRKITKSVSDRQDLRALVKDLRSGPRLPALNDSLDVLSSFQAFQMSDANCVQTETNLEAILIPNVKRSLRALGALLNAVVARDASVVATSSRVDVAKCLCNLLLSLLNTALPLGPRHSILPHIMGELTMHIIRPIIRGFHALSVEAFTRSLNEKKQKPVSDIRPDIFSVLKRLLGCLQTLKARTRDLREFMIFETAKEVESLWRAGSDIPEDSRHTCEHRIERLARKDSLWYHCSVFHAALDQLPTASNTDNQSLLCSAAVQVLANLVCHLEGQTPVDQVAKGMILAVIEKAWLSGLYGSEIGEGNQSG